MRTPLHILFFLFALLLTFQTSLACSCAPSGYDFCTSQQNVGGDVIILGKKLNDFQHGMNVEVLEVLAGTENRDTVMIWGDTGWLCRLYASGFVTGDTFVFSVNKVTGPGFMNELPGEYWINVCGVYSLNYHNGLLSHTWAKVTPTDSLMTYEDFKNLGGDCLRTGIEAELPAEWVKLYPNPTSDELILDFSASKEAVKEIRIVNALGNCVYHEKGLPSHPLPIRVPVTAWSTGVYFVHWKGGSGKILVQ